MLPDVTVPAPVVTLACVIAVAICVGETPSAATCFGFSWTFSCICCTPERVTACTPSMACRRGTTRVPSSAASCSGGKDEDTASCTTGMLVKLSAATFGAWAVAGSICCTPDTDCWTSASLAFISVPNSYCTVTMLMPSLENESNSLTPFEVLIACSIGVKEFDSFSNDGMSIITVQYEFGTNMKAKEAEVQQSVSGVQQMLPATAQAPKVAALNFTSMPVVQLAVSSSLPPEQLAALLGTRVVPRLQAIDSVQAVTLSGVQQMQLNVQLKPKQVAALGVSPTQIATAITQANVTTGAGTVTSGSMVYPITVSAKAETEKALEDLVLPSAATAAAMGSSAATSSAGGTASTGATSGSTTSAVTVTPVTLGDVATVKIAPAPLTAVTRTNGKPSIGISVSKSSSGNTVDIANAVADELPSITKDLGGQATVTTVIDQSIFIKDSISSLLQEGIVGALFAIIVIWVFLRSWRSTIIAGLSIPLSVIGALIILWSQGDSLNMLTLGGLTIAIGRVIDDSIVVIENIYRHLQEGDSIRRAAYTGTPDAVSLLQVAVDVLDDHDRVVDDAPDGDGETAQGEHVQGIALAPEDDQRADHAQRDGEAGDDGRAPAAQEHPDDDDREDRADDPLLQQRADAVLDEDRLVDDGGDRRLAAE